MFIWFSNINIYVMMFPLNIALAASHKFWCIVFFTNHIKMLKKLPYDFFIDSMIISLLLNIQRFIFSICLNAINLKFNSIMDRKCTLCYFNLILLRLVLWPRIHFILVNSTMSIWKKYVFCYFWLWCSININQVQVVYDIVQIFWIFNDLKI